MVHGIVFQDETKFGDVVNINDTNVNYENSSQSIFYVICLIFFLKTRKTVIPFYFTLNAATQR